MRASRRSKVEIYYEVLDLFCQEGAEAGTASLTKVANRAKIPYYRFQKIARQLIDSGIIQRTNTGVLITEKGLSCLHKMEQTNKFLHEIGLWGSYPEPKTTITTNSSPAIKK